MEVHSYIKSIISPELRKSVVNRGVIKPGDQLQAQIIDIKANGRVLVDFGKFRSFAEVTFPVVRGAVIDVKVIDIGEQIKLKVIDPELKNLPGSDDGSGKSGAISQDDLTKLRSHLKHIIDSLAAVSDRHKSPLNLKNTLESIHAHLRPLIISGDRDQLAADIKSYLDTSGIFFEKKLEESVFKTLLSAGDLTSDKLKEMAVIHQTVVQNFTSKLQLLKNYFDTLDSSLKTGGLKGLASLKNAVADLLADTGSLLSGAGEKPARMNLSNIAELLLTFKSQAESAGLLKSTESLISGLTSYLNDSRAGLQKDLAALLGNLSSEDLRGDPVVKQTLADGLKAFLNDQPKENKAAAAHIPEKVQDTLNKLFADAGTLKESLLPKQFDFLPQTAVDSLNGLKSYFEFFDLVKTIEKLLAELRTLTDRIPKIDATEMTRLIAQALENPEGQTADKLGNAARLQQLLNQDLKPNLVMLKTHLGQSEEMAKWVDRKTLEQIKTTVDKLISDIVGQQTDAANKQGRPDLTQVFSFSLPLEETRQNARLKIYYPKKNKDTSKEGFRISVLLNMDRLGEIRTDLHLFERDLSITFFVQDIQNKIRFENSFQEILQELLPYFDHLSVKAVVSEKKIEEFDNEDHQISSDGMLDVKV